LHYAVDELDRLTCKYLRQSGDYRSAHLILGTVPRVSTPTDSRHTNECVSVIIRF